jgi:hypothetical protein
MVIVLWLLAMPVAALIVAVWWALTARSHPRLRIVDALRWGSLGVAVSIATFGLIAMLGGPNREDGGWAVAAFLSGAPLLLLSAFVLAKGGRGRTFSLGAAFSCAATTVFALAHTVPP